MHLNYFNGGKMSGLNFNLPYEIEQVVLGKEGHADNGQRTFKVNMVIIDQDTEFMTSVASGFVGKIIGYKLVGDKKTTRTFVRLLSVDTEAKMMTVCPVEFKSQQTEDESVITEKSTEIYAMNIADLADLVTINVSSK